MKVPAPDGLRERGREFWSAVTAKYAFREDELMILGDVCRLRDVLAALEAEAEGKPMLVRGSMGQPVLNPLLAEQKTHRLAAAALLTKLKIPDDPSGAASQPNQHRSAAQSRWASAHGHSA